MNPPEDSVLTLKSDDLALLLSKPCGGFASTKVILVARFVPATVKCHHWDRVDLSPDIVHKYHIHWDWVDLSPNTVQKYHFHWD